MQSVVDSLSVEEKPQLNLRSEKLEKPKISQIDKDLDFDLDVPAPKVTKQQDFFDLDESEKINHVVETSQIKDSVVDVQPSTKKNFDNDFEDLENDFGTAKKPVKITDQDFDEFDVEYPQAE